MRRVVVVGGPGSGKTTLAARVAKILGCGHVELDALWWQPDWTPIDVDAFAARLRGIAVGGEWVADGNYLDVGADILWSSADTLVWLDPPRSRAIARVLLRTTRRIAGREKLWAGNRQTIRDLSPSSIMRLVRNWPSYSKNVAALVARNDHDVEVIRVRTRADVSALLARAACDADT